MTESLDWRATEESARIGLIRRMRKWKNRLIVCFVAGPSAKKETEKLSKSRPDPDEADGLLVWPRSYSGQVQRELDAGWYCE